MLRLYRRARPRTATQEDTLRFIRSFAPDPAFKGKPRELVAADYAYSLKRLLDPALRSPWMWVLEGKLVGGDEVQAAAKKSGKLDYDAPLAGLELVDRYTLRIRLKA